MNPPRVFYAGIVLSWNMLLHDHHEQISTYQLFAYQETSAAPLAMLWKKVGVHTGMSYHKKMSN